MLQRRNVILGALGAAAGLAAAGCSSAGDSDGTSKAAINPEAASWRTPAPAAPVKLTITPVEGAAKVSPIDPIVVTAEGGKLQSVKVTAGSQTVAGELDSDGVTWRSTGKLGYGKTYELTASVVDSAGVATEKTSTFTTVKPKKTATITFQANNMAALKTGGKYGCGQPVIVRFSKPVSDRATAVKAIEIETTPAVPGKFHWVSDSTVHWRPAKYWVGGTKVKVTVNALGVDLGKGVYGAADATTHFTVSRALVAVTDNRTHRTKVYINGKLVRNMACSTGRGGYTTDKDGKQIHFWTHNGPHVVLSKERTHSMSSASYGLTDPKDPFYYPPEDVEYCTRISYTGEFLHAAPWNPALGRENRSHGCVNLSMSDAKWVYENFLVGDVVEVINSPKKLGEWEGVGDWLVPYAKYGD